MNENDGFDDIVSGSADDGEEVEFETIMDAVEYFWKRFNPGHLFVKGMLLVETVAPEGRGNTLETSSPITDADVLGMLEWGKSKIVADINAQSWLETVQLLDDDDDELDVEDE